MDEASRFLLLRQHNGVAGLDQRATPGQPHPHALPPPPLDISAYHHHHTPPTQNDWSLASGRDPAPSFGHPPHSASASPPFSAPSASVHSYESATTPDSDHESDTPNAKSTTKSSGNNQRARGRRVRGTDASEFHSLSPFTDPGSPLPTGLPCVRKDPGLPSCRQGTCCRLSDFASTTFG
ncbi:hypothetical protein BKA62DRAFT_696885 [Auriculariales sp. MPI-PUGE-AT-0066]|nr:hypothetical protein BKA62DRAFT_696885 [Auriculariales sp. MPI-PUGE-AT-0066]